MPCVSLPGERTRPASPLGFAGHASPSLRFGEAWCPGADSNRYAVRHRLLRPACLPIPPPGLTGRGLVGPRGRLRQAEIARPEDGRFHAGRGTFRPEAVGGPDLVAVIAAGTFLPGDGHSPALKYENEGSASRETRSSATAIAMAIAASLARRRSRPLPKETLPVRFRFRHAGCCRN